MCLFFATATAQNRFRDFSELQDDGLKVCLLFKCAGGADGGAEQAATTLFLIDDQSVFQRQGCSRADCLTMVADALTEACSQTAGRVDLQIIPAADRHLFFCTARHGRLRSGYGHQR